ncbi:hypothetical protein SAMN02745148_03147 [Modicisalibacter ilicicola DSM 19980]|uniref:Uncharacterized protein n=1 Tax=Modicisalibacter ilicicola DSM 19980 TaxID=1121942 RepID=A0A1M5D7U1_9GAMM|nr:hypothetical protein SAMN02745148_03147 [Halomonas ilicicola DSM 19980]
MTIAAPRAVTVHYTLPESRIARALGCPEHDSSQVLFVSLSSTPEYLIPINIPACSVF